MDRRARFDFAGLTWETSISAQDWIPMDEAVGGQRISAAGIPASYTVRRDVLLEIRLRVRESEWPSLLNLITYGQTAESFVWFPDADNAEEFFDVYLHAPVAGERFAPSRMADYPQVFEASLTLRGAGTDAPWKNYYGTG